MIREMLLIGLGSIVGANARYAASTLAAKWWGGAFPYGTLVVNVSGSFVLGWFLAVVAARAGNSADWRALVAVGLLGSYTTFSTFAYETIALIRQRDHRPALANAFGTIVLGVAAAGGGLLLARLMTR